MKAKIRILQNKNFSVYGVVALIVLFFYTFLLSYFLYASHKEIKNLYINIEDNKINEDFIKSEIERIKKVRQNKITSLDLQTDNLFTKFVNSSVSFNDKSYVPEDLTSLKSPLIDDMKGRGLLRLEAKYALVNMSKDFYQVFKQNIKVFSAYRSYNYQKGIKNRGCPDRLCAKAGYSEHQSGLAVDLWEATTKSQFMSKKSLANYYYWLKSNAHKYGFHNTYQKGLTIDGYEIEPWHWRYLGVELATYLKENNLTIAEFYNSPLLISP